MKSPKVRAELKTIRTADIDAFATLATEVFGLKFFRVRLQS